ncbi:hypothetical protein NPIL_531581 [Nephila pilipes]|uniref:Uncharacterized protein n=1 Tax=Nephila pilipes TaxID=299642 RepID=A0A8X6PLT3_NEPPI|nr:hypothetical protein NPIL_531581 [Nephila pilipes]
MQRTLRCWRRGNVPLCRFALAAAKRRGLRWLFCATASRYAGRRFAARVAMRRMPLLPGVVLQQKQFYKQRGYKGGTVCAYGAGSLPRKMIVEEKRPITGLNCSLEFKERSFSKEGWPSSYYSALQFRKQDLFLMLPQWQRCRVAYQEVYQQFHLVCLECHPYQRLQQWEPICLLQGYQFEKMFYTKRRMDQITKISKFQDYF